MEKIRIFEDQRQNSKFYGVKGVLLFACVVLTIISPAVLLGYILLKLPVILDSLDYIRATPGLGAMIIICLVFSVVVNFLGIYAGLVLWKQNPRAVLIAKSYFVLVLVYGVVCLFLPRFVGYWDKRAGVPILVISAIEFGIWFTYFSTSKRVKATYAK